MINHKGHKEHKGRVQERLVERPKIPDFFKKSGIWASREGQFCH